MRDGAVAVLVDGREEVDVDVAVDDEPPHALTDIITNNRTPTWPIMLLVLMCLLPTAESIRSLAQGH
jgi:hypothetical protein